MVDTIGKKNHHKISYPSIPSAIRPVPHSEELLVSVFGGFPHGKAVMMIRESMRAAITKWFLNLNRF